MVAKYPMVGVTVLNRVVRALGLMVALWSLVICCYVTWWFGLGAYDSAVHRRSVIATVGFLLLAAIVPGALTTTWRIKQRSAFTVRAITTAMIGAGVAIVVGMIILIWSIATFPL